MASQLSSRLQSVFHCTSGRRHNTNGQRTMATTTSAAGDSNGFLSPPVPRVRRASAFLRQLLKRGGDDDNDDASQQPSSTTLTADTCQQHASSSSRSQQQLKLKDTMKQLQMDHSPFQQSGPLDVTDGEIDLLRRSWSDEFDFLYNFGTDIYAHIFEQAPDAQHLFPALLDAGDRWRETSAFRNQALKFVQVISYTIKNLTHAKQRETHLAKVGAAHVRLVEKGFRPHYWTIAKDAIEFAIQQRIANKQCPRLRPDESARVVRVWGKLAVHIVEAMHAGFVDALRWQTNNGQGVADKYTAVFTGSGTSNGHASNGAAASS